MAKIRDLLVFTSYPEKGEVHGKQTGGVASYTKQLIDGLKQQFPDVDITVFADRFGKKEAYLENEITVKRRWVRGRPATVWSAIAEMARHDSKHVFFSFEAYMWGQLWTASLLILASAWLRIKGKRVTVLLHQILDNFHTIEPNWFRASILNIFKDFFYRLVRITATQVVVFEEEFKARMGDGEHTYVLPHLIHQAYKMNKNHAKARLGWQREKKYALYFGFLALYKGVDWLMENWPENSEYQLIIAGGMSNTQKNHPQAVKLYEKLQRLSAERNIPMVGFVPENLISTYFSACDLLVLPYQLFMSSSGPLSLAMAYEKPFLISEALLLYQKTEDFYQAEQEVGIDFDQFGFKFSKQSLAQKLVHLPSKQNQIERFCRVMKHCRSRSWISRVLFAILSREEQFDVRPMVMSRYLEAKEIE